jgi:superfamily II DNA or RNA helicase
MKEDQNKSRVQQEARRAWEVGGKWGLLAMATGTGKSKIAIDVVTELSEPMFAEPRILLVVPTEKLRDDNWLDEFNKWGAGKWYKNLQRSCYVSITKYEFQNYDLVILDEAHNLTDRNSDFFQRNTVKQVLALTATPPNSKGSETDKAKALLFQQFRIKTDFEYTLDQAVASGLVAPFHINVVECTLDDTQKYIKAGNDKTRFYQTEAQRYKYVSDLILRLQIAKKEDVLKFKYMERMRVVQNSIAKTKIARAILDKYIPVGDRALIFCGSIKQSEELMGENVYHSKSGDAMLQLFQKEAITRLGCVEALNEGINVPNVDQGLIVQLNSSKKDLVQRIGRLIRKRPGHKALVWIIVAVDTVDKNWFAKAIEGFDESVITYIHAKNL